MSAFHLHRRFIATFATFLTLSFQPACAWAWGNEGHRITGLVASELLTAKTRIRLNQLVPGINLGEFANQMDLFRTALSLEVPGSEKWHFDNQPACGSKGYADYCPNGACASGKIDAYFNVLADKSATQEARAQAAMFLVHLVGDIHQPLHASDDADFGGNQKNVLLPNVDLPRNLHRVWDSDLPKLALRGVSEPNFAKQLIDRYQGTPFAAWQQGTAREWVNETNALSRRVAYSSLPGFACGVAWAPEKVVRLPQAYVDAALDAIPAQLAKAGVRMAWLLNRALDAVPGAQPATGTADAPSALR